MKRSGKKKIEVFSGYAPFLQDVKGRIRSAQVRATLSANGELIMLYWDIGRTIADRQEREGWGAAVIPRLARDIQNDMPEVRGFSDRNLKRMVQFYHEYPRNLPIGPQPVAQLAASSTGHEIGPQPVAQLNPKSWAARQAVQQESLPQLVTQIPWAHNVILMQKVRDLNTRFWYMQRTMEFGWSRNMLALQIDSQVHKRAGRAVHNFRQTLPSPQSDLAEQALKDPYIFDFLTLAEPFRERELELGLLAGVEKFLLELGQGFAFVGRQFHVEAGDNDFYLDLLFYHLRLRCFVVVDLKKGAFKPEYVGKMNFYCNLVDDQLRHSADQPTIGLVLCQDKDRVVAEYALRGVEKSIGVSQYRLTRALPKELQSSLPSVEDMEARLVELSTPTRTKRSKRQ